MIKTFNNWCLRNQLFEYLINQIEAGALTPGSLINVRQLTNELGVSRTPLREALAQLEVQGLVTIMPQRGVMINVLTYDELIGIFEILGALESQALKTAFDLIDKSKIDTMEEYNRKMARSIVEEKNRVFHETNIQLHDVFLGLSENMELTNYVSVLKLKLFGFALKSYRNRFKEAIVREHEVFITLLRAGKKDKAINFLKNVHWKFNYPENFIRPDAM